jgi:hypothetical protein
MLSFGWMESTSQKRKISIKTSDANDPQFVTEIEYTLDTTIELWYATEHVITVVNAMLNGRLAN